MAKPVEPRGPALSRHASVRCQQRGITRSAIELLMEEADHAVPVGSGREAFTLSRAKRIRLRQRGICASALDRAARQAIVVGADGTVITVLYPTGTRGRRYRHRFHTHAAL